MKEYIINNVEEIREELIDLSKKIWENPELAFEEKYASSIQKEYLKSKGFKIEEVENLPTGFIASFGEGKPVIGILGEYDALPELSQCVSAERKPLVEGKAGHGCGHNLLGVAGVGAVVSIKKLIEENKFNGTIKYFGCPAEEEGGGKTVMCINGCFDDVDCAFTWHPFDINAPWRGGSLANLSVKFKFKGITAHAAQAPHNGRSALDAVEIMNVGANYLREHVIDSIRMHYVITNGGGRPNVVPGFAESWYFIRGKKARDAEHVLDRLIKVAQGAAMMTETEMEYKVTDGIYDYIPNLAAKSMGGGFFYVLKQHLLPNFVASIMFMVVTNIGAAIGTESTLSFLGIGLPIEIVSWGSMLSLSEEALLSNRWWIILIPGIFLVTTLVCITNIGNYIRKNNNKKSSNL